MSGLPIGTWFGFRLRVHWSWLLIFGLVTWNLTAVFDSLRDDWSTGFSLGLAAGASLALFVSVLVHELAHSIVARSRGMEVRDITLFLFGGVSNIEREPPDARSEFMFTVVGPIASVVIGVASLWAAWTLAGGIEVGSLDAIQQLSALELALLWLGQVNILLAVFNLLPGFPLDGGRILRSALWAITGDLRRATRWAAGAGQVLAFALVATGVAMALGYEVPVLGAGIVGGLWLVVIGLFLNAAAASSYQQVVVEHALAKVPVADVMKRDLRTAAGGASVDEVVHEHILGGDRAVAVTNNGDLEGLVCLEDVRAVPREQWTTTAVRDVMTPASKLTTVAPDSPATDALRELSRRDVDQLPVVRPNGHLEGLVRRRDIMSWLELDMERR